MRKIHVFVKQGGNYSFKQHHSSNHFKITYYLLQLFLWWPLWGHLMTSALWKHKPQSFSKLSSFLIPGELPFPQLSHISGFLRPHQRKKGTVWGVPPPIHSVNILIDPAYSQSGQPVERRNSYSSHPWLWERMDCSCCLLFRDIIVANSSVSDWHGGLCSVPCSSTAHVHQAQKGEGCRRGMLQTIHRATPPPQPKTDPAPKCDRSDLIHPQALLSLCPCSYRPVWEQQAGRWVVAQGED